MMKRLRPTLTRSASPRRLGLGKGSNGLPLSVVLLELLCAVLLGVSAAFGATEAPSAHIWKTDADGDGLPDEAEQALAERYAPRYFFHQTESWHFVDPDRLLHAVGGELNTMFPASDAGSCLPFASTARCSLLVGTYRYGSDDQATFVDVLSRLNPQRVATLPTELRSHVQAVGIDNVCLLMPNRPDCIGYEAWRHGFEPDTPLYYLCDTNAEGNVELQFFTFSQFNTVYDPAGFADHDGDWTWIVLVFRRSGQVIIEPPVYAYCSCHSASDSPWNPRYLFWADVMRSGTHPDVLVGKGSHEGYFKTAALTWYPDDPGVPRNTTYNDQTHIQFVGSEWGASCGCNVRPYYISHHVVDWYEVIGMYDNVVPTTLVNMGSMTAPSVRAMWLTYGGKWGPGDGPYGPLGAGAHVRLREHRVRGRSTEGDWSMPMRAGQIGLNPGGGQCDTDVPCSGSVSNVLFTPMRWPETGRILDAAFLDSSELFPGTGSMYAPAIDMTQALFWAGRSNGVRTIYVAPGVNRRGGAGGALRVATRMTVRLWPACAGPGSIR